MLLVGKGVACSSDDDDRSKERRKGATLSHVCALSSEGDGFTQEEAREEEQDEEEKCEVTSLSLLHTSRD